MGNEFKQCNICNRYIKDSDNYSVINGKIVCSKHTNNNTGQINISSGNSVINAEQNINIDKKKYND